MWTAGRSDSHARGQVVKPSRQPMTDSPVGGQGYEKKKHQAHTPYSSPSLKKVKAFPTHSHLQPPKWQHQLAASCYVLFLWIFKPLFNLAMIKFGFLLGLKFSLSKESRWKGMPRTSVREILSLWLGPGGYLLTFVWAVLYFKVSLITLIMTSSSCLLLSVTHRNLAYLC